MRDYVKGPFKYDLTPFLTIFNPPILTLIMTFYIHTFRDFLNAPNERNVCLVNEYIRIVPKIKKRRSEKKKYDSFFCLFFKMLVLVLLQKKSMQFFYN